MIFFLKRAGELRINILRRGVNNLQKVTEQRACNPPYKHTQELTLSLSETKQKPKWMQLLGKGGMELLERQQRTTATTHHY